MMFRPAPFLILVAAVLCGTAADASVKPLLPSSAAMVTKLTRMFQNSDRDGDALLNPAEWRIAAPIFRRTRSFARIDRNRNGAISISEFARSFGRRLPRGTAVPVDRAKRSFVALDSNSDWKLTYLELKTGGKIGNFEIQGWFDARDEDGSGFLQIDEWRLPDFSRYVGLPIAAAEALAGIEKRAHRVISLDGVPLVVTTDYSPFRVNFTVFAGVVIGAIGG